VLADAACENEGVEPAKSSGQSPQELLRLVTKERDRLGGAHVVRLAVQQLSHVRARPRDAEESGLLVEEIAHLGRGQAPLLQQKEWHARVEVAAPRAHYEPAGRGKAHGRVDTDAAQDGGHACPVAEVRDDDAPGSRIAVETAQLLHYVLVGEAVEAVADDALLCELPRKRVEPGDAGHPAVECGVEANYLRDRRVGSAHGFDRRYRLGKVVWIDRHQCPEIGDQLWGDPLRLAVAVPTVDNPVSDRRQIVPVEPPISQPTHEGVERGGVIRQIIPNLVEGLAAGVSEAQAAALAPDPARLSPQLRGLRRFLPQAVQGGLQAGRTGVDRQQPACAHDALYLSRSGAKFYTGWCW